MKTIIIILALFISVNSFGQVFKYRAKYLYLLKFENAPIARPPKVVDVLISVNLDRKRINIFSNQEKSFDIIDGDKDKNGDMRSWSFYTQDQDGNRCNVIIIEDPGANPVWTLLVQYTDQEYRYDMDLEN